jgi:hypothetical protein
MQWSSQPPISLAWLKRRGDQGISKSGELIPAFYNDSEIDVIRCSMDG